MNNEQLNLFEMQKDLDNPNIHLKNGNLIYYPSFFSESESDFLYKRLIDSIEWKQDKMSIYGRDIPLPRLSAWYGDAKKPYTYSGIRLNPLPWTEELLTIKRKIEVEAGVVFTSVLLNRYRDGKDYIGWHADAEKELGQNPVIGSVNFGATRRFQLRRMDDHKEKFEVELKHGTLLVMNGETQHFWQHQVPKTASIIGERLNLTFRVIDK